MCRNWSNRNECLFSDWQFEPGLPLLDLCPTLNSLPFPVKSRVIDVWLLPSTLLISSQHNSTDKYILSPAFVTESKWREKRRNCDRERMRLLVPDSLTAIVSSSVSVFTEGGRKVQQNCWSSIGSCAKVFGIWVLSESITLWFSKGVQLLSIFFYPCSRYSTSEQFSSSRSNSSHPLFPFISRSPLLPPSHHRKTSESFPSLLFSLEPIHLSITRVSDAHLSFVTSSFLHFFLVEFSCSTFFLLKRRNISCLFNIHRSSLFNVSPKFSSFCGNLNGTSCIHTFFYISLSHSLTHSWRWMNVEAFNLKERRKGSKKFENQIIRARRMKEGKIPIKVDHSSFKRSRIFFLSSPSILFQ